MQGDPLWRRALSEYVEHFHTERNHQGKGNVLLFPRRANTRRDGHVSMPRAAERPVDLLPLGGSVTACQQMAHRLKQKAENNADKGRAAGATYDRSIG